MNPEIPDGIVVYAVSNIQGSPCRAIAAHELIAKNAKALPASMRRIIIYMGNYIKLSDPSDTQTLKNLGAIEKLISTEIPGFERIFLKGENEESFFKWLAGTDGLDETIRGARQQRNVNPAMLKLIEEWREARLSLSLAAQQPHREFLRNLKADHTMGDYLFCISANPLSPGKYGIFSREGSSSLRPHVSPDSWLAFNVAALDAVVILKLERDERNITIAGDHEMNKFTKKIYDEAAADHSSPSFAAYRIKKRSPLTLPGGSRCPVWTSPVLISG